MVARVANARAYEFAITGALFREGFYYPKSDARTRAHSKAGAKQMEAEVGFEVALLVKCIKFLPAIGQRGRI